MVIVTGGAGFIGANTARALLQRGLDVEVVDDLSGGGTPANLEGLRVRALHDKERFLEAIAARRAPRMEAVVHLGAITDTRVTDRRRMLRENLEYSTALFEHCAERSIPLVYASSAAVYGDSERFSELVENERPLNVYGESKALFDAHVRRRLPDVQSPVAGLRYFNVYGPGERHKGPMASCVLQFWDQVRASGRVRLFGESGGGYGAGEQRRDFIHVEDVVKLNLWFLLAADPRRSGIYNAGTGRSSTFNELANEVLRFHGSGSIEYVPFPASLQGRYQNFTQADLTRLRAAGYAEDFTPLADGIQRYLAALAAEARA